MNAEGAHLYFVSDEDEAIRKLGVAKCSETLVDMSKYNGDMTC
jgi:hypothetical protein